MENNYTVELEDGCLRLWARDQEWTPEAREALRREQGVLFREDSVVPVLLRGSLVTLGTEDDGVISFAPGAPRFHVHWAPGLAADLLAAAELAADPTAAPTAADPTADPTP